MTDSILLKTLRGEATERPPFWFMRQAGRVLPSYMALKEKYSFWQMMKDPKLGAEVTLLPINDLGVDAAILFSDILVIPYAMGMGLEFSDSGPEFEKPLSHFDDPVAQLKPDPSKLQYIYDVIDEIMATKPAHIPLIGFCGAPLTVLCYMLQGIGRQIEFPEAIRFIYRNKKATKQLIDAIVELSIIYAQKQHEHGIQVFQLFETHAGLIPNELYNELFMPAVEKIGKAVRALGIPFIYFPKGMGVGLDKITPEICDFVSIDWQVPIEVARKLVDPGVGLQGNLDPRILLSSQDVIEKQLERYIEFGQKNQNWIFNLGHGFLPTIPYENARFMADWVRNADWKR
ncbi:uroporphyrinogen decarboxylase [Prolixibacteraceae bacterium JC049]|nr:uroporphyrinogen decarboxylase [Prolixibacteraceae bacterium JC049]